MNKILKYCIDTAVICLYLLSLSLNKANAGIYVLPPDSILNLKPWSLALPININGQEQMGTKCISITNTALNAGYTSKYFYSSADTGVTFWCPIDGATTSPGVGSDHPRTELVETTNRPMGQKQSLTAIVAINQYASKSKDIIIGQIHGAGTFSYAPFVMLHATNGSIIAYVKGDTVGNTGISKSVLLQNVAIGAKLSYTIYSDSTDIYFTASCAGATGTGKWNTPIPAIWSGLPVRFSAGDYVQDTGQSSTDGGKVTFYKLVIDLSKTLPVPALSFFEANKETQGKVKINWALNDKQNNLLYKLERSDGNGLFHAIATIKSNENTIDGINYSYTDTPEKNGYIGYRLLIINDNGEMEYSKISTVNLSDNNQQIVVASIASNNTIFIRNEGKECIAQLYTEQGKIAGSFIIKTGQYTYPIPYNISKGIYYLKTVGNVFKVFIGDK